MRKSVSTRVEQMRAYHSDRGLTRFFFRFRFSILRPWCSLVNHPCTVPLVRVAAPRVALETVRDSQVGCPAGLPSRLKSRPRRRTRDLPFRVRQRQTRLRDPHCLLVLGQNQSVCYLDFRGSCPGCFQTLGNVRLLLSF